MLKAILWDMDGVIADSGKAHYLAWQALFAEREGQISREDFARTFGMANPEILRELLGPGVPDSEIADLAKRKEALFRDRIPEHVVLLPGISEWLLWARHAGIRNVVASSGEMANIVATLSALGISNHFDAVVSGAFLPKSKPHPAIFLQAAAAVGAPAQESLVIEDGIVGVEAARRAGMRCIALTTTHSAETLLGADLVVDSLVDVSEEALRQLFS